MTSGLTNLICQKQNGKNAGIIHNPLFHFLDVSDPCVVRNKLFIGSIKV